MFAGTTFLKKAAQKLVKLKDSELEFSAIKQGGEITKQELDISVHTSSYDDRSDMSESDDLPSSGCFLTMRPKEKKIVKFSSSIAIFNVPCRSEINIYSQDLYWTRQDFTAFKSDAVSELRTFMSTTGVSGKIALKLIYQPENIIRSDDLLSRLHDNAVMMDSADVSSADSVMSNDVSNISTFEQHNLIPTETLKPNVQIYDNNNNDNSYKNSNDNNNNNNNHNNNTKTRKVITPITSFTNNSKNFDNIFRNIKIPPVKLPFPSLQTSSYYNPQTMNDIHNNFCI